MTCMWKKSYCSLRLALAAELSRVSDRLADRIPEFTGTRRQTADAAVAFLGIARRDVDEHHLDAGMPCDLAELPLAPGVGELDLDRLEAHLRRRLEALGKLDLLEQHADVGAEAGHRPGPRNRCSAADLPKRTRNKDGDRPEQLRNQWTKIYDPVALCRQHHNGNRQRA